MPIPVITGFVDRIPELTQFSRMLDGRSDKRILCLLVDGEQGKTYLLLRMFHECERRGMPVVYLDFDQRRSGLTDYLSVARGIRRHLGDDWTPATCACEEAISGSGAAPTADQIARQRAEMGRALCRDLAHLADLHRPVVVLVDTFEHASADTCAWLERWLFEPLRLELPYALLVIAGRPVCRPFFDQPSLWTDLVTTIDRLTPLDEPNIRTHFLQRGLTIPEQEMPLIVDLTRAGGPSEMARVGDLLMQIRGGRR